MFSENRVIDGIKLEESEESLINQKQVEYTSESY